MKGKRGELTQNSPIRSESPSSVLPASSLTPGSAVLDKSNAHCAVAVASSLLHTYRIAAGLGHSRLPLSPLGRVSRLHWTHIETLSFMASSPTVGIVHAAALGEYVGDLLPSAHPRTACRGS